MYKLLFILFIIRLCARFIVFGSKYILKMFLFKQRNFTTNCIRKINTRKSCIASKIKHIENKANTFLLENKKIIRLNLLRFCKKKVLGKNENLQTCFAIQKTELKLHS